MADCLLRRTGSPPAPFVGKRSYNASQRVRRTDTGAEVTVSVNATPVRDSSGNVTMAVVTVEDITAMRQAEESLRTSEKLAAVGRMAGTLAHEINNPLDAVNNLVYLLLHDSKLDEHGRECVQLLQRELERIQHIVANTLSFYRDSSSPVQVNLSQVLDSVLTLDARKIERKHLQISKHIEANVSVMGFPGELRQVFLNLVTNAIEATPDRGKLRIHIVRSRQWQKEDVVGARVVIADNGHGISTEQRSKLFQPFFTTKGEQGTGLGLWVSQGIVRKHQGEIRLRSTTRFGRSGTCFSVFLPIELPETKREKATDKKGVLSRSQNAKVGSGSAAMSPRFGMFCRSQNVGATPRTQSATACFLSKEGLFRRHSDPRPTSQVGLRPQEASQEKLYGKRCLCLFGYVA